MQNKHTEAYVAGKRHQKVKQHVQENQTVYAVGGTCVAVGFIGGIQLGGRSVKANTTITVEVPA